MRQLFLGGMVLRVFLQVALFQCFFDVLGDLRFTPFEFIHFFEYFLIAFTADENRIARHNHLYKSRPWKTSSQRIVNARIACMVYFLSLLLLMLPGRSLAQGRRPSVLEKPFVVEISSGFS